MDIIEETIENIPISELFKIIYQNIDYLHDGDNILDAKIIKGKLPETLINNLVAVKDDFYVTLKYKNEVIPQEAKIFEFEDKSRIKNYYKIYTKKYYELILKKHGIINPIIIFNNNVLKSNFDDIVENTKIKGWELSFFKIVEQKTIDYKKLVFDEVENEKNKTGNYYTKNFKHYFKYQKEEDFKFNASQQRSKIYNYLIKDNSRIKCYCGPHGIGKTTTFLVFKKKIKNFCYFNLKYLFKNVDNVLIWKNELILLEIAETFKSISTYEEFVKLLKEIEPKTQIWE